MRELRILCVFFLFFLAQTFGQTFWTIDFESAGGYTPSVTEFTDASISTGYDYWGRINHADDDLYDVNGVLVGDINGISNLTNILGSFYFGGNDIDGEEATLPLSILIDDVEITGKSNLNFKIYVADNDPGSWESTDYVHIDYDIDNSGSFTNLLHFESDGSNFAAVDTDFDGDGDGTAVTESFSQIIKNFSVSGTTIDIRVSFYLNAGGDQLYIDELELGEIKGEPTDHASSFSTFIKGYDKIDLLWSDASSGTLPDGYLISASTTNSFSNPADGTDPIEDTDLSDGSALLKVLQGTQAYSFTSLNPSTQYYFKMWSYTNSGIDIDFKTDGTPPTANETTSISFVINEFLADPDGDANGDGITSSDDDEFIEFINNTGSTQDLGNWTIEDENGTTHTFSAPTEIADGEAVVVFGGGTPTGINGVVQTTGSLSLNNSGDDIILKDDGGQIIASYTYSSEANVNESIARYPDITGEFVLHSTIDGSGNVDYSPGNSNSDGSALPVELTTFTAELVNNSVELNWQTATEVNNYGFNVERVILNSQSSILNWTNLGFVQGHGTTNSPKEYQFVDSDLPNSDKVSYRLKQIDNDGKSTYSKVVEVDLSTITDVDDENITYKFGLDQNYPNPFNPTTTVKYTLPELAGQQIIKLRVFNLLGQQVSNLVNASQPAGQYEVSFDASDLPSGIYFYTLSYGSFIKTRKLVLMK